MSRDKTQIFRWNIVNFHHTGLGLFYRLPTLWYVYDFMVGLRNAGKEGEKENVKVTLSSKKKLKGMKYSTAKNCRHFLIHRIRWLPLKGRAREDGGREREKRGWKIICCCKVFPKEITKWKVLCVWMCKVPSQTASYFLLQSHIVLPFTSSLDFRTQCNASLSSKDLLASKHLHSLATTYGELDCESSKLKY